MFPYSFQKNIVEIKKPSIVVVIISTKSPNSVLFVSLGLQKQWPK
jgi:hypothetical protein